ncbi:hypothetical protein [Nonomuraea basaltis]|uniref:hypothetical protein n=1 Tax=Nonomuraea basaltis TaxID=2495887 RepID=UPI00110C4547|nr:hypothetical protein [Nonomuraea basaltis]TMR97701.1 hypothetical protein EJK15_16815 [Nonomuraea basaltis]
MELVGSGAEVNRVPQQIQATGVLFDGLLDDAAIFPPGRAPLPEAVVDHLARRLSPIGRYVGPFVCAGPRWSELMRVLSDRAVGELPLDVALTVPAGLPELAPSLAAVALEGRATVVSVELPLMTPSPRELFDVRSLLPEGVTAYVELGTHTVDEDLIAGLAAAGLRLKVRTGGLAAADFPSEEQLARFIDHAVTHGVPFKLTAGLHRAVRHTDPATGFEHHGFLNVLLATAASLGGADRARVRGLLAERDATRVGTAVSDLSTELAAAVRGHFCSFGTCSIEEPMADLVDLRLVGAIAE